MWKVCLCTRNRGQNVVHQWVDSSTDLAPLAPALVHCVRIEVGAWRNERWSFIINRPARA